MRLFVVGPVVLVHSGDPECIAAPSHVVRRRSQQQAGAAAQIGRACWREQKQGQERWDQIPGPASLRPGALAIHGVGLHGANSYITFRAKCSSTNHRQQARSARLPRMRDRCPCDSVSYTSRVGIGNPRAIVVLDHATVTLGGAL